MERSSVDPEREAEIFTDDFVRNRLEGTARFRGPFTTERADSYWRSQLTDLRGRRVLEYGCGTGDTLAFLASQLPESLDAIDIAPEMVDVANRLIERAGISSVARAQVMDAHCLEYNSGAFDVVCGVAILHHLDLDRAAGELARVLAPGGYAVFLEPMGYNPLINLYRRLTPQYRTPGEHPFVAREFATLKKYFELEARFFSLAILASCFWPLHWAASPLAWLDDRLLRVPGLRNLAWAVVLTLRPCGICAI